MVFLILHSRINGAAEKEREIEEENIEQEWGKSYNRAATVSYNQSIC